jgi:hypothetical protein
LHQGKEPIIQPKDESLGNQVNVSDKTNHRGIIESQILRQVLANQKEDNVE